VFCSALLHDKYCWGLVSFFSRFFGNGFIKDTKEENKVPKYRESDRGVSYLRSRS